MSRELNLILKPEDSNGRIKTILKTIPGNLLLQGPPSAFLPQLLFDRCVSSLSIDNRAVAAKSHSACWDLTVGFLLLIDL